MNIDALLIPGCLETNNLLRENIMQQKIALTIFFNRAKALAKQLLTYFVLSLASVSASAADLSFITIDVAPWASTNPESGEHEGAFIEIVKEVEKRTRKKINVAITPFARVDRELESGAHDCTILVPRSDELVIKGDVVSYHPIGFIARKGVIISSYDDIKKLKLSVTRGATLNPEFDNDETLQKEYDTDYLIGLRKVARGRLDAIVGAIPTLQFLAEQEGLQDDLEKPFPMMEIPLVFQCSKKSDNLDQMPAINEALMTIKTDGTLEKIRARYYF
jgi:polar amino acid transport system substrate-binding protein